MTSPPAWCGAYIGLPFADCGRSRSGFDCWGLVKAVMEERFGFSGVPDFLTRYTSARDRALPEIFLDEIRRWIRVEDPEPGDVVVLRIGGQPRHVGMVVSAGWMLSIDRKSASCLERYDSLRWRGRVEGFYRFGGADAG